MHFVEEKDQIYPMLLRRRSRYIQVAPFGNPICKIRQQIAKRTVRSKNLILLRSEWYRNRFSLLSSPLLHDKTWPAWPFCMTQTKRRLSTTERWRPKLIFLCFIANTLHEHTQCHPNHCNFTFTYFRNYWKGAKVHWIGCCPLQFFTITKTNIGGAEGS